MLSFEISSSWKSPSILWFQSLAACSDGFRKPFRTHLLPDAQLLAHLIAQPLQFHRHLKPRKIARSHQVHHDEQRPPVQQRSHPTIVQELRSLTTLPSIRGPSVDPYEIFLINLQISDTSAIDNFCGLGSKICMPPFRRVSNKNVSLTASDLNFFRFGWGFHTYAPYRNSFQLLKSDYLPNHVSNGVGEQSEFLKIQRCKDEVKKFFTFCISVSTYVLIII